MALRPARVRAARAMAKMDQERLAELAGVAANTVRRIEAMDGTIRATLPTVQRLQRCSRAPASSSRTAIGRACGCASQRRHRPAVTEQGLGGDQTAAWLRLGEAATRLGTTVDAVRSRIRRGSLEARRGNDGRIRVMVPTGELDQAATRPDGAEPDRAQAATRLEEADEWLREERDEALAEADHWRRLVEDERIARVKAEAERDAERTLLAEARSALACRACPRRPARGGAGRGAAAVAGEGARGAEAQGLSQGGDGGRRGRGEAEAE